MSVGNQVTFVLGRFAITEGNRLELAGHWDGLIPDSDLVPVLVAEDGEQEHRVQALPDSVRLHRSGRWTASFPGSLDAESAERVTLSLGDGVLVDLPKPNGRRFGRLTLPARLETRPGRTATNGPAPKPVPAGASALELHASLLHAHRELDETRAALELSRKQATRSRQDAVRDREGRERENARLLEALEATRRIAQEELAQAQGANQVLQAQIADLNDRLLAERPARDDLQRKADDLRAELGRVTRESEERVESLRSELESARHELSQARAAARPEAALSPSARTAGAPLGGVREAATRLAAELAKAQEAVGSRVDAYERALRDAEARTKTLEAALRAREAELARARRSMVAAGAGPGSQTPAPTAPPGAADAASDSSPPRPAVLIGAHPRLHEPAPFEVGVALATLGGAAVEILGTFMFDATPGRTAAAQYAQALASDARAALERSLAASPPELAELRVQALPGAAPSRLREQAERCRAGIVVLGARRRGSRRPTLGTTTSQLVRHAPCPVAVVPRDHRMAGGRFERVGVAFDDTLEGRAALRCAGAIARRSEATLVVATFIEGHAHDVLRDRVELTLERAVEECAPGMAMTPRVLASGAEGLVQLSERLDLLVSGARLPGPLRLVHKLVRESACPLVIVPRGREAPLLELCGDAPGSESLAAPLPDTVSPT